jgi:RNA-binding protein YlmH
MIRKARVAAEQAGLRLDDAAAQLLSPLSKNQIRRTIDLGGCAVNGTMVRVASRLLKEGDEITVGIMEPGRFRELVYTSRYYSL